MATPTAPTPSVPARVHVFVAGRVQGVWFRESTRERAERLGVSGWVRNLSDGRVEGLFEGPPSAVDALLAWCHRGPPAAEVSAVDATPVHSTQARLPAIEAGRFQVLR